MPERLPLAFAALKLSMTYHQVRAKVLRGEIRGGCDEHGRYYVEAQEIERLLEKAVA